MMTRKIFAFLIIIALFFVLFWFFIPPGVHLQYNHLLMKKLIALFACMLALTSCLGHLLGDDDKVEGFEHPVTETTDEYSITYQYKEDVTVLTEKHQGYIVKVEADTILYFSSSTPESVLPKVGDVVSARASGKLPYGLGNIVLEVSEQDGMTRCVTTLAGLDEIFEELSWEYNSTLTDSLLDGYEDENGNAITPKYVWYDEETGEISTEVTKGTIGKRKLVKWPIEVSHPTVNIEGSIFIGAFVHCSGDVRNGDFEFYVEPVIGNENTFKVGGIYQKDIWQDMFEWDLFKLKDVVRGMIVLGPVTLRPYVDIEAYFSAGASGTVTFETGKTFSARIGYSQGQGCYIKNSTSQDAENIFIKSIYLDGNIGAEYKCLFDVGCGLYTKKVAISIDPYFKYQFGAELLYTWDKESTKKESNIFTNIIVGADGKMVIDWFGALNYAPEMNFIETEIADWEYPLIPRTKENTFIVEEKGQGSYDSTYEVEGGFLSALFDIYPGIAIYKNDELVHREVFAEKTSFEKALDTSFSFDGLEEGITYTAKAFARLWEQDFVMETIIFPDDRWVDLGLSVLWAKYNVGATSPEEYGEYYAWGETETKSSYTNENYKYYNSATDSYTHIGDDISGTQYDVAHVKWGNGARMPRFADIQELLDKCSWSVSTYNGVKGMTVTGQNGNSMFLPFAGYLSYDEFFGGGYYGCSWSGTYSEEYGDALNLDFYDDGYRDWGSYGGLTFGRSVRPVRDK